MRVASLAFAVISLRKADAFVRLHACPVTQSLGSSFFDDDDDLPFGRKKDELADIARFAKVMSDKDAEEAKAAKDRERSPKLAEELKRLEAAAEAAKQKASAGVSGSNDNSITRAMVMESEFE